MITADKKYHILNFIVFPAFFLLFLTRAPVIYIDEMWFIDTAWNFVKTGRLALTAYGDTFGLDVVSFAPPIFNLLLGIWLKIFGLSLFSARSFVVFISAGILFFIFRVGISASLQSRAGNAAPGRLDAFVPKHKIEVLVARVDQLLSTDAFIHMKDRPVFSL